MKTVALILGLAVLGQAGSWRASLAEAQRLRQAGQTAAAEQLFREVLESSKNLSPVELNSVGSEFLYEARYADAETLFRRSLAGWDRLGMNDSASRAITAGNLGILLRIEGRFAEAEPLLRAWLASAEAAYPNGLDTARAASALAALYLEWGRQSQAEALAVRARKIFAVHPEDEDAARIGNIRTLASIRLQEERYAEGEALLQSLLRTAPDRETVGICNDLAVAEIRQNHLSEAGKMLGMALERARRSLPPNHPLLAATLNNLGQIERFEKRYLEAERNYREAIDIWRTALGPMHPDVGKGLMNLAAFYHERGREAGSEDLYRESVAIFEGAYGKDAPLTLVARNELAEVLRAEHRFTEAERLSRATLEPLEQALGDRDPRVLRALANYARLPEETRRTAQVTAARHRIGQSSQSLLGQNP